MKQCVGEFAFDHLVRLIKHEKTLKDPTYLETFIDKLTRRVPKRHACYCVYHETSELMALYFDIAKNYCGCAKCLDTTKDWPSRFYPRIAKEAK